MPMVPSKLKQDIEAILVSALTRELAAEAGADPSSHKKLAAAISDIAIPIVTMLLTEAQVAPGIPTAGSPAAQVTTAPGKLL